MPQSHYWRDVLIIVPIVGTTIATIFFIIRLSCRYFVAHKLRVEDLLMGMGLLCTYGVAICVVYCKYSNPLTRRWCINPINSGHTWYRDR